MIRWEIKKVLEVSQVLFLAVLLCVQTGVFLSLCEKPNDQGYSARDISAVRKELEPGTPSEQLQELTRRAEAAADLSQLAGLSEREVTERFRQGQMYQQILEEASLGAEYGTYLEGIREQSSRLQGAGLLVKGDSFPVRNIAALEKAYSALEPEALPWTPSEGMELFTDNKLTDFFLLVCMMLFSFKLTVSERLGGQYRMLHTAADGCRRTWTAKLAAYLTVEVCCIFIFYLAAFLTIFFTAGPGTFSAPIQSVHFYYQCPYKLTIGQFLVVFVLAKAAALLVVSLVVYCIGTACRSMLAAAGWVCLCAAASLILWYAVERNTWYECLKEINLLAPVYTWHYFSNAVNLNVAGYPVSTAVAGGCCLTVGAVIALALSRRFWEKGQVSAPEVLHRRKRRRKGVTGSGLFPYELNKLLFKNKGIAAVIVMIVVLATVPSPESFSRMQYYYQKYAAEFSGPLTEEKKQKLLEEEQRIADVETELEKLAKQLEDQEITIEVYQMREARIVVPVEQQLAFQTVLEQYDHLEKMQSENCRVVFLDESGWRILSGEWGKKYRLLNGVWIYVLGVLLLHNFWIMERSSNMELLIRSAPDGQKRIAKAKRSAAAASFLLLAPIPWLYRFVLVTERYDLPGFGSLGLSSCSVSALGGTAGWCPLLLYYVLQFLAMEAEAVLCMLLMLYVARRMKNEAVALCAMSLMAAIYFGTAMLTDTAPAAAGRDSVTGNLFVLWVAVTIWLAERLRVFHADRRKALKD